MTAGRILIAHPSPDLYGADLQMLVTLDALIAGGHDVVVAMPTDGPLGDRIREHGGEVIPLAFPVLRKSVLHPRRLLKFALGSMGAGWRGAALLRRQRCAVLLVNTLTLPSWLLAGRLAGVRILVHVHEAEEDQPLPVRLMLAGQLLLAHAVIVNSASARGAIIDVVPALGHRTTVVHNGIPEPASPAVPPRPRAPSEPCKAVLVGRWSPRKGTDVALDAVAVLRSQGHDVTLDLCGSVFPGYEWFEVALRERAARSDLAGAVTFHGYVDPVPVAAAADVVLVPSRVEPFGNVAVEAMLARRPLVASRVQGLREVVRDGTTGVLVTPGDSMALAEGIRRIVDHPAAARAMTEAALLDARSRFSVERYASGITAVLASVRQPGGGRPSRVVSGAQGHGEPAPRATTPEGM